MKADLNMCQHIYSKIEIYFKIEKNSCLLAFSLTTPEPRSAAIRGRGVLLDRGQYARHGAGQSV